MANKNQIIVGKYSTKNEVLNEIKALKNKGFFKETITLYMNSRVSEDYKDIEDAKISIGSNHEDLSSFKSDIENGHVVITVKDFSEKDPDNPNQSNNYNPRGMSGPKSQVNEGFNKEPLDYGVDADPSGRSLNTEPTGPDSHPNINPSSPFSNE